MTTVKNFLLYTINIIIIFQSTIWLLHMDFSGNPGPHKEFTGLWYYCNNNTTADTEESVFIPRSIDMSISEASFKRSYSNQGSDLIDSESSFGNKPNTMPSPTGAPWDVHSMPWSSGSSNSQIMEFNASPWKNISRCCAYRASSKRKSEGDSFVPRKQLITDEKMAAHFNSLHISPSLIAETEEGLNKPCEILDSMDDDIIMEMDTETKLKTAQKIILSDEVKNISNEPLLPASILNRLEKPCKAVVLWQPPPKILSAENENEKGKESPKKKLSETDLLSMPSTSGINTRSRRSQTFMEEDQQCNNNNSFEMDLNTMNYDMDI